MRANKSPFGHGAAVRSDINVTPLVDVVLVLLIIFMVVTPYLQKGQAVRLPETTNPDKKPEDKNQVLVSITNDKILFIDKSRVDERDFPAKIKEVLDRNQQAVIMLKADNRLNYGEVKDVVLKIREAGFRAVGLVAQKRDKTK